MGILNKLLGRDGTKPLWVQTEFGFIPWDLPGQEITVGSKQGIWFGIGALGAYQLPDAPSATYIERLNDEGKMEKVKVYAFKTYDKGECRECGESLLVPQHQTPPFFSCPICSSEQERMLITYLLHLNHRNEVFEMCPLCSEFDNLGLELTDEHAVMHCPKCDGRTALARENEITLAPYPDAEHLIRCAWCGHMFENGPVEWIVDCPNCTSAGILIEE